MGMTMKKKNAVFIAVAISISAFLIICAIICVCVIAEKNLLHFFDKWEPEVAEDIHIRNYYQIDSKKQGVNLFPLFDDTGIGVFQEVFCEQNNRLYFCYTKSNSMQKDICTYYIASCDLSANDFQIHYSADFQISLSPLPQNLLSDYYPLNYLSSYEKNQGGAYSNGQILLQDQNQVAVYDIALDQAALYQDESEIQSVLSEFFHRELNWEIHNQSEIVFSNNDTGEIRILTLEKMAESNEYANALLKISDKKTWDKNITFGEQFFSGVKILDGEPYVICKIFRWDGNSIAIVFKYDFDTNTVKYVKEVSVGGVIASRFDVFR